MAETAADTKKIAVPEMLKHPMAALESLEAGAKKRLGSITASSNARLAELEGKLSKVAKEDWSFSGMFRRAESLSDRAKSVRVSAVKRIDTLPCVAVSAITTAGRSSVQELSKGLQWVAARLENGAKNGACKNGHDTVA